MLLTLTVTINWRLTFTIFFIGMFWKLFALTSRPPSATSARTLSTTTLRRSLSWCQTHKHFSFSSRTERQNKLECLYLATLFSDWSSIWWWSQEFSYPLHEYFTTLTYSRSYISCIILKTLHGIIYAMDNGTAYSALAVSYIGKMFSVKWVRLLSS